jgi:hypothetical protein
VIRPFAGKTRAWVYDFYDVAKYMGIQANERIDIYNSEPAFRVHFHKYDKKKGMFQFLETRRLSLACNQSSAISSGNSGELHATK